MKTPEYVKISLEEIKISKKSLVQFGNYRGKFQLSDVVNRFKCIYKIRNRNSMEDKAQIKNQIKEKLDALIKDGIIKKKGIFFIINSK